MLERRLSALIVALVIIASASSARAERDEDLSYIPDGWFVPMGVNVGMSVNDEHSDGLILGGEMSLVHLADTTLFWTGGYVDGVHDFGANASRVSFGPEMGWMFGGVEAGYLTQWINGELEHGFRVGLVATLGLLSLYGRWGHLFDAAVQPDFVELGVLLKFPFPL